MNTGYNAIDRNSAKVNTLCILVFYLGVMQPSLAEFFTVFDPIGDASGTHDVIEINGGFTPSNVILSADFNTGTLNIENLGFIFGLDIDEDASTGLPSSFTSFPVGAEFSVFFHSQIDPVQATIFDLAPSQTTGSVPVGNVPVSFTPNALSLSVPFTLLGNDDGPMNFGFIVGDPTSATGFDPFDTVPDGANNGPLVGPITLVPEPSSYAMFFCILLLFTYTWKRH